MRSKGRVYGPYPDRAGYRVVVTERGERSSRVFATASKAQRYADNVRAALAVEEVTLAEALVPYERHLRETITDHGRITALRGVRRMLPDDAIEVDGVDVRRARALYEEMRERPTRTGRPPAVATHHVALRCVRAMWRWMLRREIVSSNPWREVDVIGRPRRGKPQLTLDEARTLTAACLASDRPDAGAVLCCLLLGLRSGEVARIDERCLDDGGRLLRVPGTKTEAARRVVEVPELLRAPLAILAADPGWTVSRVRHGVERWCERAGVPVVPPHGLRGTHASLAASAGATGVLVAAQLGHASPTVTAAHYTQAGAAATGGARTALKVLAGGR